MLSNTQHRQIIDLVREQGDYAASMQSQVKADASMQATKADQSIVTQVDLAVSRALIDGLSKITPGITVLSEEGKDQLAQIQQAATEQKPIWVVDPLDGTASYAEGYQEYAVNVGLLMPDGKGGMKPELGFVYFPGKQLFLYTDTRGKAVQWDTATDQRTRCNPKLQPPTKAPCRIAIGWRKGDNLSLSPLSDTHADEQKYTGPFRAAKVIIGDCHASVMNGGVSIWDTAGIQAVASAAGLAFMPFDDTQKQFTKDPMYYGGDVSHYYKGYPLANPPYVCASAAMLRTLGIDAPAHAKGQRVGR